MNEASTELHDETKKIPAYLFASFVRSTTSGVPACLFTSVPELARLSTGGRGTAMVVGLFNIFRNTD